MYKTISFSLFLCLLLLASACQDNLLEEETNLSDTENNIILTPELPDTNLMKSWLQGVMEEYPHRRVGSPYWYATMDFIEAKMEEVGIENISKDFFPIQYWEATNWSLQVQDGNELIEIPVYYEYLSAFTPPEGITAPLVYVGEQVEDEEEVAGKIVVADMEFNKRDDGLPDPVFRPNHLSFPEGSILGAGDVYWQALDRGAVGVILLMKDFHGDINEYFYVPHDTLQRPVPSYFVGNRQSIKMRCYAQLGLDATMVMEGSMMEQEVFNLWGTIPGQNEAEYMLYSTHADAPFQGAIEDGTGIVSVLAQAYAWAQADLAERPKTTAYIFTAAHMYANSPGGFIFSLLHPDIIENTKVLFELEHIGAKKDAIVNDEFVTTEEMELVAVAYSGSEPLVSEIFNMIENYPLAPAIQPIETMLPLTEAAGFLAATPTLPYLSIVTSPTYLFTKDDVLEKVNFAEVKRANESILMMGEVYMEGL